MSGQPAARITDSVVKGKIVTGSLTVLIGSQGGLACSVCPGGITVSSPVNPQLGAKVLLVDVADPASVSGLAWQLDGEKIELALYVAGVWDAHSSATPPTREQFDRVMHTNVLGAMQVLPQVAPRLRRPA